MATEPEAYTKTLDDELDWKMIDQLYGAVSQVSGFCFEIKKFCVTTLFVVLTILVKFTNDKLDHSIFATSLIITFVFWFLDSVSYYYQVKLRGMMDSIRASIHSRGKVSISLEKVSKAIEPSRIEQSQSERVFKSAFNHSMWLYSILFFITFAVWVAFGIGWIR